MQLRRITCTVVLAFCLFAPSALAQWTNVGEGIDYREYTLADPNNVFVARMSPANADAIIESSIANGRAAGARETVSGQAARYDGAINDWGDTWGRRNDVVVAVNGDFFNMTTGLMTSGQIQSGWNVKWYYEMGSRSGFAWKFDRSWFIGGCPRHPASAQRVTYVATSTTQYLSGLNRPRSSDELVLYTPQYDNNTGTDGDGTEVLVQVDAPTTVLPAPYYVRGYIREIRQSSGSSLIPFDYVVLSASGSAATALLNNASVGGEVRISQDIVDYEADCTTATNIDWTRVYAAIGGNFVFLKDSVIQPTNDAGLIIRNPRTAICYNSNYVFFVVVDGRDPGVSVGMTSDELGAFCRDTLGATWGVNQDGGGSSAMWVNGTVMNNPSDGSERTVSNGIMMVNVQAKTQSSTFFADQPIRTTGAANCRLGPGTNYYAFTTLAAATEGTITDHDLNGVSAKGYNWWKCNFNGTVGWVAESLLESATGPAPYITQDPAATIVAPGGTATFTVAAIGTPPLSYQWQKDGANLTNGGNIAGATTTTLDVSSCQSSDEGDYRCVVTNAYGNATSDAASLTVSGCFHNAGFEEGFTLVNGSYFGNDWTKWESATGTCTGYDETTQVYSGSHSQRIRMWNTNGGTTYGGVYQRIPVTSGQSYTVSAYIYAYDSSSACDIGVNPAGGTDPNSGVTWSSATTSQSWVLKSWTGTATSNYLTLFLRVRSTDTTKRNGYFDVISPGCGAAPAPPTITQQPAAQEVCPGDTATFTVAASGAGTLTYQWQKNQVNVTDGGHFSGTTTTTLTVSNTASADAGSYRCVVTNTGGSTNSNAAALTVKAATTITQQPSSQTVAVGSNVSFSVTAAGDGTLTYQWQKDGANLTNGGQISGATSSTLQITGAQTGDAGNYACVVAGGCGNATSNTATLTLTTACITNADFESGFTLIGSSYIGNNWTKWESVASTCTGYDETTTKHGGSHSQRIRVYNTAGGTTYGGVYQRITVTSGASYTVSVYLYAYDTSSYCYLGVDPAGGTNPNSGVTWSTGSNSVSWVQKTWSGTATSDHITIFYRVRSTDTNKRNGYFDDATPACSP